MTFEQFGEIIEDDKEGSAPSFAEFGEVIEDPWSDSKVAPPPTIADNLLRNISKGAKELIKPDQSDVTRIAGQSSARGLEGIAGLPRSIGDLLTQLSPKETLIKGAEKVGLGEGARTLLETREKFSPHKLFPTQQQVRGITKKLFKDQFEPKNKVEQVGGDIVQEAVQMAFPLFGSVSKMRSFLTASAGNLAKEGALLLGASPQQAELAKVGAYGVIGLIHPDKAKNFYNKQYELADKALPENATYSSSKMMSEIESLENSLKSGGGSLAKPKKIASEWLDKLKSKVQGAQFPIQEGTAFKRDINGLRTDLYNQLEGNKPAIKTTKYYIDKISKIIDEPLEAYGKKNPQWWEHYSQANNARSATYSSEKAGRFIKKNLGKVAVSHLGLASLLGHLGHVAKTAAGTAGLYPLYQSTKTLVQMYKSPALKKEFLKLYSAALKGNSKAVTQSIKKLDRNFPDEDQSSEG